MQIQYRIECLIEGKLFFNTKYDLSPTLLDAQARVDYLRANFGTPRVEFRIVKVEFTETILEY